MSAALKLSQTITIANTSVPVVLDQSEYELLNKIRGKAAKATGLFIDFQTLASKGLIKSLHKGGFNVTPLGHTFLEQAVK